MQNDEIKAKYNNGDDPRLEFLPTKVTLTLQVWGHP